MTCFEFKTQVASLPVRQVSELPGSFLAHERRCASCGAWLREHQSLVAAMQGLRLKTAGYEAGPEVERALLRAFRQHPSETVEMPAASRFAFAFGMNRGFGIGAYAALAATIVIALLVGYRVLRPAMRGPVLGNAGHANTAPANTSGPTASPNAASSGTTSGSDSSTNQVQPLQVARRGTRGKSRSEAQPVGEAAAAQDSAADQALARSSYMSLMFCDPLSCSGEAQVVRMEVPVQAAGEGQIQQTIMADVVVGDDGLVRAVRFLN